MSTTSTTNTGSQSATPQAWVDLILGTADASEIWADIFARLRDLALDNPGAAAIHRETIIPDRFLAETAWDLWQEFPRCAPSVISDLKKFWVSAPGVGTAVLVLDALSLRELPLIVTAGKERGLDPVCIEVRASEVPTETDRFAEALGLPSRSKLYNNNAPDSFVFTGPDVHTELLESPFADCVATIPTTPRLFIWHKWPDEPLIHLHEDQKDGPAVVAVQTKKELSGDGFWALVNRLRQGRRLVITGDHGYADASNFSNEEKNEDTVKLLRSFFGAGRSAKDDPAKPWPRQHLPPLVCRHNGWLAVMGQRKWSVQGGFPNLCHRGLSLLEAAVPFLEFAPK